MNRVEEDGFLVTHTKRLRDVGRKIDGRGWKCGYQGGKTPYGNSLRGETWAGGMRTSTHVTDGTHAG